MGAAPNPIFSRVREGRGDKTHAMELSTYLPPVVIVSLGLLGLNASSKPQVSVDVQGPKRLLVPEGDADRFQGLPLTVRTSMVSAHPGTLQAASVLGSVEGRQVTQIP